MKVLRNIFDQRLWGFRLVEVVLAVTALLALSWVYLSTVHENRYDKRMIELDKEIRAEREAVRDLRLKVAGLEKPSRIEALATEKLGMKPLDPDHEAGPEALQQLAVDSAAEAAPAAGQIAGQPGTPQAAVALVTAAQTTAPAAKPVDALAPAVQKPAAKPAQKPATKPMVSTGSAAQ